MNTLSELLHLFDEIPASFWGVVFGSFFSIAGVAISNRASDRRLRAQFNHEREQKTKDREMALRRDIYLSAAEAIDAGINAISRFANFDMPNDQVTTAYTEKAPAISKVHVIARTDTVQALATFTGQLGTLFLTLFAKRLELLGERTAIDNLENQIAELGKERDRILEIMKQHNIDGIIDMRRWNTLQENFEVEQKRIKEAIEQRDKLFNSFVPKHLEFLRECSSHSAKLGHALIPVLSAVRAELELPLDELAYRQVVEAGLAMQQEAIDTFIQRFMPNGTESLVPGRPEVER